MSDEDVLAHLNSWPGLDLERCLLSLGGRLDRCLRMFDTFTRMHQEDGARIRQCLSAGQFEEAHRLAHSLKGVAATLGLLSLNGRALALEQALKPDADTGQFAANEALLNDVEREIALAVAHIVSVPGHVDAAQHPAIEVSGAHLQEVLTELEILLTQSDTGAEALVRSQMSLLQAVLGTHYGTLVRQIENFDFDAALATLTLARRAAGQ
jgi:HPt (histidine-containing phosphotransfer) domain-containing protein